MKLSARNQIPGTVTRVQKGQTTGHVHIDIGNGITVHASITNEAIDDLERFWIKLNRNPSCGCSWRIQLA
jgi:molybdopterin-binding protein